MPTIETVTAQGNPAVVEDDFVYVHREGWKPGSVKGLYFDWKAGDPTALDEKSLHLMRLEDAPTREDFLRLIEEQRTHRAERDALDRVETPLAGSRTPGALADHKVEYGRGIAKYLTPGHGYFKVSPRLVAAMPAYLRNADGWYEEDCEAAKVTVAFPDRFTGYERRKAIETLLHTYPDAYEAHTGTVVTEGMSYKRDEEIFLARHKDDYLGVSATTSPEHPGMIVVTAVPGGDREHIRTEGERTFLVPKDEYLPMRCVIDLARHTELGAAAPAMR